jgi:hypothetical protein
MLHALEHPVEGDIVECPDAILRMQRLGDIAASDVGMRAGKPDLLRAGLECLEPGFSPHRGLERVPVLVDCDRVQVHLGDRRQLHVVEFVALPVVSPEALQRHTQCSDGVEHADAVDLESLAIVNERPQLRGDSGQPVIGRGAIIGPGKGLVLGGAVLPLEQAGGADQPDQGARRIGAAREAKDENLVIRLVVVGEEFVGASDVGIEAPAEPAAAQPVRHARAQAALVEYDVLDVASVVGGARHHLLLVRRQAGRGIQAFGNDLPHAHDVGVVPPGLRVVPCPVQQQDNAFVGHDLSSKGRKK